MIKDSFDEVIMEKNKWLETRDGRYWNIPAKEWKEFSWWYRVVLVVYVKTTNIALWIKGFR